MCRSSGFTVRHSPTPKHHGHEALQAHTTATAIGDFVRQCAPGLKRYFLHLVKAAALAPPSRSGTGPPHQLSFADKEKYLIPHVQDWEQTGSLPDSLYKQAADDGLLMPMAAGASIPSAWRGKYPIIGDIAASEWDGFHDFIMHDELGRVGGIG